MCHGPCDAGIDAAAACSRGFRFAAQVPAAEPYKYSIGPEKIYTVRAPEMRSPLSKEW
jgi:hypothetical protein